jgi:hypothetical protein
MYIRDKTIKKTNMKRLSFIILLSFCVNMLAQVKTKGNITIEVIKTKAIDNKAAAKKATSDLTKKLLIKTKIVSNGDEKTQLSGFSLLDTINKTRYRLADYKGYDELFPELTPYRKTELFDEKGVAINAQWLPPYNKEVKDYFNDFDKEGYTNVELPVNFGTNKEPKISVVYFGETSYKKLTAELYFTVSQAHKDTFYELYYKDEKIAVVTFVAKK